MIVLVLSYTGTSTATNRPYFRVYILFKYALSIAVYSREPQSSCVLKEALVILILNICIFPSALLILLVRKDLQNEDTLQI